MGTRHLAAGRAARGAALVVAIMFVGSLVLWIGTPLLWLWIGSLVQGVTGSIGAAFAAALIGALANVSVLGVLLAKLSAAYRANRRSRGLPDTGHSMLELVLAVSAAVAVIAFVIWFFFIAGASPLPIGIQI